MKRFIRSSNNFKPFYIIYNKENNKKILDKSGFWLNINDIDIIEMDYDNDINNIKKNIAKFNSKEEAKNFNIKTAQEAAKRELGNTSSIDKIKLYIKYLINEAGIKYISSQENFNNLFKRGN